MEKKVFYLLDFETNKMIPIEAVREEHGGQWKALCAKCKGSNQTVTINDKMNMFHCYKCGWAGDLNHLNPAKQTAINTDRGKIFKNHWKNYHGLGLIPYPAAKTTKGTAVIRNDQKTGELIEYTHEDFKKWENEFPDNGIWVLLGDYRVVLDPDGPQAEKFVQELNLPDCPVSKSGKNSTHRWFKTSEPFEYIDLQFGPKDHLEVRTGKIGMLVPPSIHPETGRAYQWELGRAPWEIPFPQFPKEIYDRIFSLLPPPKMSKPCNEDNGSKYGRFDMEKYLSDYGIEISKIKQYGDRTLYLLKRCLWSGEHGHGDKPGHGAIMQWPNGKLGYKCFHASCCGKGWEEAREAISGNKKIFEYCEILDQPSSPLSQKDACVLAIPDLGFPRETIGGLAGRFAEVFSEYLESPYSFFVFDYLTCLGNLLGDRVTLASEIAPQPRLYTFTIGPSGDARKSESQKKTVRFFLDTFMRGEFNVCQGVGSAEGLALKLGKIEQNPKRLLLVYDEAKAYVSKAKIDGSTLLPCVNTFFESNQFHSATKSHDIEIDNAYLSMLAASTRETFEKMWTPDFLDIGFINRLWLVYDHAERRFSIPREISNSDLEPMRKKLIEILSGIPKEGLKLDIDEDAREVFDTWYLSEESYKSPLSKRLDTYGLRLMILLAINEGVSTIDAQIAERVVKLLNWQLLIRRECDVIDAETNVAKVEELIRRALSKGPLNPRELKKRVHYERYGIYIFQLAIDNLQKGEEVFLDNKAKLYCLR